MERIGYEVHLVRGVAHDRQREGRVDECAEIHLAQRDDKAGVNRQEQKEIEFAGADEFGKVGAVDEEEGLGKLLDEGARADEHDDLPFGPRADVIGVEVKDADEAELEAEPEEFDDDPKQKVALENHFAGDGVFPESCVNGKITRDW